MVKDAESLTFDGLSILARIIARKHAQSHCVATSNQNTGTGKENALSFKEEERMIKECPYVGTY
jgi:hypothetical protein